MSSIVKLYVDEITKDGATMTIDDVPAGLREKVAAELSKLKAPEGAAR